jgi:hypothetical protein
MNFAFLYSQNPTQVKEFFGMLENISNDLNIKNLNFLTLVDNQGNTLLHLAVQKKDLSIIQSLFKLIKDLDKPTKSILLDKQNNNQDTAFHIAVNLCEKSVYGTDDCLLCETIAKFLDLEGCKKNIPNKNGLIIDSSQPPVKEEVHSTMSEYKSKLIGGKKLNDITSEISINYLNQKPIKNLDNITTEVSIDNLVNPKKNLNEYSSEVSIDKSKLSNSESSITESTSEKSSFESSGGSSESVTQTESSESSSSYAQNGGAAQTESSGLSNTSEFVKTLLTQFNSMKGGSKNRGERQLPSLSDYELSEIYGGRDFGLSREQMKESSNIHDQVVQKFIDSGKSEDEARILKMALYKYTKDKHPELNNLDRAKKMMDYAEDNSILKKLDLASTQKIYEEVKKTKSMNTESSEKSMTSEITESTEEKPKKKAKAEPKKKTTGKKSKK